MPRDRYAVCRVKFHPWDIGTNGFCSSGCIRTIERRGLRFNFGVEFSSNFTLGTGALIHFEGCFGLGIPNFETETHPL